MAIKGFLLQGFTAQTHLAAVKRVLACPDLDKAILSIAFVNKAGVDLLATELAGLGSKVDVYAGIRNDITSRQGLRALLDHGANVHYVDTGARHVIFHPKIYFASSPSAARMIVGSANLTPGGLNNNIEASVTLDLDLKNGDDSSISASITKEFAKLTTDYPSHVVRVTNASDLDTLHADGRLVDEASSFPPRTVTSGSGTKTDGLTRIKLMVSPLTRSVKRSDLPTPPKMKPAASTKTPPASSTAPTGAPLELVWESKPLAERDLNVPTGTTTNKTGSINLDKGLLDSSIDHRHYFRDEVFPALSWSSRSATVDEASARFGLIVKGVAYGEFELSIRHTTSTTSKAYKQRNAMTRLSWGEMKPYVARPDLIGRTMSLYRNVTDPSRFVIEID